MSEQIENNTKNEIGAGRGVAVVTGASAGIGKVYAKRLAKRGYDLILVARNQKRLEEITAELAASTNSKIEILVADLTDKADLRKVEDTLRHNPKITLLVNNAGIANNATLAESELDGLENMIKLNVTALTRLSGAIIPEFIKRGSGAIINIASVVALAPELLGATYSASKAYVLSLSQTMHHELSEKGIQIQAVLPGATDTELWDIAGTPISSLPKEIVMTADDMVDAALEGFDRKELVTIPSLPDAKDWEEFLAARKALAPNLSLAKPALRYQVAKQQ